MHLHNNHNIHEKQARGLSGPAFQTATSANSLAVINKPVRVGSCIAHTASLIVNGMGLGSRGPVSMGRNATLTSYLYITMINSSVTACDPFNKKHIYQSMFFIFKKKRVISKCNKDGDNNTATQSKGHSMRLPWVHTVATTNILWAVRCDPADRRCSAVK